MKAFVKPTSDAPRVAAALRAFGAHRSVAVLDLPHDPGDLVMEYVTPGVPLAECATEAQAMRTVAALLADGGWPSGAGFEPLADFARVLNAPHSRFSRAASTLRDLIADASETVLLHGDLHYGNVLSSDRAPDGFVLIDPKGVAGEPSFDIGYLVSRPTPRTHDTTTMAHAFDARLEFLPDALGLDRRRVAAYAYVAAALSCAWAIEDRDGGVDAFEEAMRILQRRS